jgi:hypothetical protein
MTTRAAWVTRQPDGPRLSIAVRCQRAHNVGYLKSSVQVQLSFMAPISAIPARSLLRHARVGVLYLLVLVTCYGAEILMFFPQLQWGKVGHLDQPAGGAGVLRGQRDRRGPHGRTWCHRGKHWLFDGRSGASRGTRPGVRAQIGQGLNLPLAELGDLRFDSPCPPSMPPWCSHRVRGGGFPQLVLALGVTRGERIRTAERGSLCMDVSRADRAVR